MEQVDRFQVYRRADGLWDWKLTAANGQIIATSGSQGYTERNDAIEGWERVRKIVEEMRG